MLFSFNKENWRAEEASWMRGETSSRNVQLPTIQRLVWNTKWNVEEARMRTMIANARTTNWGKDAWNVLSQESLGAFFTTHRDNGAKKEKAWRRIQETSEALCKLRNQFELSNTTPHTEWEGVDTVNICAASRRTFSTSKSQQRKSLIWDKVGWNFALNCICVHGSLCPLRDQRCCFLRSDSVFAITGDGCCPLPLWVLSFEFPPFGHLWTNKDRSHLFGSFVPPYSLFSPSHCREVFKLISRVRLC